jgi:hypothetical protein
VPMSATNNGPSTIGRGPLARIGWLPAVSLGLSLDNDDCR